MSEKTVKLGLMPPFSGLVGIYGEEIARAGQIACQEVNEGGGVLGKPLDLVIEDDGSLPESAVAAALRLVDEHGCSGLIGNLLSNSRIAVAYRVAEPRRIPYLNFSFYEGSILSRYFFHFAALPNQQIDRMIPYMRQRYGPRMFFAGNAYEWPRGSIDAAKRALEQAGGTVAGEIYLPIGVSPEGIEEMLDEVAAASPDVFVPYFAGNDQVRLLNYFTERGMKQGMGVVMGHYDELMASQLRPEVREGFYSSNTYFMTVDTPRNREVLARLSTWPGVNGLWPHGNGILTNFGEGTYLCVKAFAQAANEAGSLDTEVLIDRLAQIELSGPQGSVRMDRATHHARVNTYLSRCQKDGSFALMESFGPVSPVIPERYGHLQINTLAATEEDTRLQARMLDQMSDGVFLISADTGKIVYASPGAYRMFGYGRNELLGQHTSVLNWAPPNEPESFAAEVLGLLSRKGSWQGEVHNVRKDGSAFWTFASVSAFSHPVHGEVWMAVNKDITQLKAMQLELEEKRHRLEKSVSELSSANRELENFTFATSHDLRGPLGRINSFSTLLYQRYRDRLDGEGLLFLDFIRQNANRLAHLVDDLLNHARVAQQTIELQPVAVPALARAILQDKNEDIREAGAEVRLELPAVEVLADPHALTQALSNLLENALKYAASTRPPVIEIGGTRVENRIQLWVRDNGIGFDMAYHDRIFEMFRRLHTFNDYPGSGVGLTLVKRAMERMGGRVWAESALDQGATFFLELQAAT